jgi:4-amino-4-deoxy-L-arabinose transferase-like glycosyltransferase
MPTESVIELLLCATEKKQTLMSQTPARVAAVLGVALCIAATLTHIYLGAAAEYATGALAILDHLFDLVAAVVISFVLLSAGNSLTKRFSLQFVNSAEHLAFSFFLGTGVVGLLVLLMGLLGLLRSWPILALLLLALAFTARDLPELWQSLIRATQTAFQAKLVTGVFIGLLVLLVLRTLTPPHIADELIYHLPVPQQFVQAGRVFPSYDNSLGNMPFLLHMIYALFLWAGSDVAAKLFSLFLAIATAVLLYAFCCRFITRHAGVIALFAFFASGMIVELAITTRIDVSLAGMLFACTYAMINYLSTRSRAWLWLSAVFAGFSLGIKHTAALWIFLAGILYLVETIRGRAAIRKVLQYGVIYTFLALAVASPWYIKNAAWFHNPIYPFVTGEVAEFGPNGIRYFNAEDERKLDAHFDTARKAIPDVVVAQQQELASAANTRVERHPMRLWEFFFRPQAYLMAEPYQFPNYLFLVIPLLVFLKPTKWIWWLLILGLGFVFSVTATAWISRYLVPAYPALTIVAAYTLYALSMRLSPRLAIAKRIPVYALALAFIPVIAACVASLRYFHSVQYVAGTVSRHEFLTRLSFYQPLEFVNRELPSTARVMMIGDQMNYGLNRSYYADESWFVTKWRRLLVQNDSLDAVNESLKQQGFTHIIYGPGLFTFAARMGLEGTGGMSLLAKPEDGAAARTPEYPLLRNWSTFTLYKERYLEPIYSDDNFEVLRIK